MTKLEHPVARLTRGMVFEKGEYREVIVILRPPDVLEFKVKGIRGKYTLTAGACYTMAVKCSVSRGGR